MVQSPVAPNTSIERILAFYVKWCSTIGDEYFVGHRQPNTASIAWLTLMEGQGSSALYTPHHDIFSVSSSLPGGNPVKLQAAEIRHECLMTLLAPRVLPKAPRHGQVQTDGTRTWVDWGHCAETLAVLWFVITTWRYYCTDITTAFIWMFRLSAE
jgi:hypothetical protein